MMTEQVEIVAVHRRMRGASQPYLVSASDGHFYVAKFTGNPEGNRTLINELLAHWLSEKLQIQTPPVRVLQLARKVIDQSNLRFQIENRRMAVLPGVHFGSRCPVNPKISTIYDFLPRKFYPAIINRDDFAKALVLDTLLGKADGRQCVFVRQPFGHASTAFRAYMIDNGGIFAGSEWLIRDSEAVCSFFDLSIYSLVNARAACEEAAAAIQKIDERELYRWMETIPRKWLQSRDYGPLASLFARVCRRFSGADAIVSELLATVYKHREWRTRQANLGDKQP